MAEAAVCVENVTLGYGERIILQNVSFEIRSGEIVALLGGSGCGKSTMLKAIIGLLPVRSGDIRIDADSIDEATISSHMATEGIPDPDLMIRTGGDCRVSNYLLWQIAYSELIFTDTFWPDYTKEDFCDAILRYQSRERRFGKTSEQVNEQK